MSDCGSHAAARAAKFVLPHDDEEAWSAQEIRTKCRRRTQNYLQTPVHAFRTSIFWPNPNTLITDLSDKLFKGRERQDSLKEPGASEFLMSLPANNPMDGELFQTAFASHLGLIMYEAGAPCAACGIPMDADGRHPLSLCHIGAKYLVISRNERHNDGRDFIHGIAAKAQLPVDTDERHLLPGTDGIQNDDRPGDV